MAKRAASAIIRPPPKRELYLAFRLALTEGVDEFEGRITRDWRGFRAACRRDAAYSRVHVARALQALPFKGGVLSASAAQRLRARNGCDAAFWDWMERGLKRAGIVPTRRRGQRGIIEVMNRRFRLDRGGPRRLIDLARGEAQAALKDAASPLRELYGPQGKRFARRFLAGAERGDEIYMQGQGGSFVDNIVRSFEQAAHQASAHVIDATSGPMREVAVRETALKFDIPVGVLGASFLTHQRAAFRATVGAAAHEAGATHYTYYVPSGARGSMSEEGFGARHHAQVRTEAEWDRVRRRLAHKRAGSFLWTTGFHVNDRGYLLPVFGAQVVEARAVERQKRQKALEKLRSRKAVA